MKRIWVGVGLLLGLLILGFLVMHLMGRQLSDASDLLQQAAETGDWERSVSLAQKAQEEWEQKWRLIAALSDHAAMDQIDLEFAQLQVYQKYQSESDHAAACASLSKAIGDLKENHRLTWWNLL